MSPGRWNGSALDPPPGVVPNLDDPPNSWDPTITSMSACLAIVTLALLMRMFTKIRLIRQVDTADYAIIMAWGLFIGYYVATYLVVRIAARVHQWDVRLENMPDFLKYVYVAGLMYGVCCFFIKLSILLQLIHLFVPNKRAGLMWWACWVLIVFNFVFYTVYTFVAIFACRPISAYWDVSEKGDCIDTYGLDASAGIINTVCDLILLVLPQYSIWRLNRTWRQKLSTSILFLLGVFASVSSAARMVYSIKVKQSKDVTFYAWYNGSWSYAEITSGIVVACLPTSIRFFTSIAASPLFMFLRKSLEKLTRHSKRAVEGESQPELGGPKHRVSLNLTSLPFHGRSDSETLHSTGGVVLDGEDTLTENDETALREQGSGVA